jgi:hypothetical protein
MRVPAPCKMSPSGSGTRIPPVLGTLICSPSTNRRQAADRGPGADRRCRSRSVITLQDKPYLEIVPTPGLMGAAPLHLVTEPGRNTAVAIVDAGRGLPIGLSLRRHGNAFLGEPAAISDAPLFTVTLDAPTWEVV